MSTHNIGFHREIRKIVTRYPLLSRPVLAVLVGCTKYRLVLVFAGYTGIIVGFVVCWLSCVFMQNMSLKISQTMKVQINKHTFAS